MDRFQGAAAEAGTLRRGRMMRAACIVATALFLAGCGTGAAGSDSTDAAPRSTAQSHANDRSTRADGADSGGEATATLRSVVDGDTIETSAGTVRIIGIDTPERGQCGYDDAKAVVTTLIAQGDELVLGLPEGQNDQDKYGRILRYVTTKSGVDLGLAELRAGQAVARFDSSDGYPAHPRERAYHDAQLATLADGRVVTTACAKTAEPAPTAAPAPTPAPTQTPKAPVAEPPQWGSGWWTQYRSCSALKKNSVGHPKGPFDRNNPDEAQIYNWFEYGTGYHGDGDGDGLACE